MMMAGMRNAKFLNLFAGMRVGQYNGCRYEKCQLSIYIFAGIKVGWFDGGRYDKY